MLLALSVPILRTLGRTFTDALNSATEFDSVSTLVPGASPVAPPLGPVGYGQNPPIWPAS